MATVHRNLTGADLHEPKGADTATAGKVYVSDGAGSGVWTDASTIITNTAFTTGDYKLTGKVTADTGWILFASGTIGDGSSSATIRANADTSALFTLYWNNYSNALCPVSGGRGASAAADFAAHKTLTLPDMSQRVLGVAGSGNVSLTARTIGTAHGAEVFALSVANLPAYTPSGTLSGGSVQVRESPQTTGGSGTGVYDPASSIGSLVNLPITASQTFTGTPQGGTNTAFSLYQPTAYINLMIKL